MARDTNSEAEDRTENAWDRERAKLDASEYDQELGEYVRRHEKSPCASFLIEEFLESCLKSAIPCPKEGR